MKSAVNLKPKAEELNKYSAYHQEMEKHKMTPRPLDQWLVVYRTAQARIARAAKNAKATKAK